MKALILAGGAGTRLRPLTHTSAKQLVPVANKPVLMYGLEAIIGAGIREVGIIVGATHAEIREALGDGSRFGIEVTYIPQEEPLGLAHCVLIARDFLGEDDFVMYLGDNFILGGITEVVERFREGDYDAQILLTQVADPTQFGVAELDDTGRVIGLEEKPKAPKSDLALVGVYIFNRYIHDAVQAIRPSSRGELEITDAIQHLIDGGRDVRSHQITGYWKDTGRVEDMLECNRTVLESLETRIDGTVDADSELIGRVVIEAGAKVVRSRILGPAIIGVNTTVVDAYIGPYTAIAHGCILEDTEIEYSIVMSDSRICGVRRIDSSLIGREVEVTPSHGGMHTHRLVLGDHSKAQIHS
jgi:glucose-1-phosphate thymidylyltransferase